MIDCRISGIIEDSPSNSHLPFNMILSISTLTQDMLGINFDRFTTSLTGFGTYVLLPANYHPETFESQAVEIIEDIYGDDRKDKIRYHLEPLNSIHFDTALKNVDNSYTTDKSYVYIYFLVGLFILLIASINFINLSTAQVIKRSKEVGIRKVIGAFKKQLIFQFILETFIIVCAALVLAVILSELITPILNDFLGYGVNLSLYSSRGIFVFLLIVLVAITFISGIYPSLIISRFKPYRVFQPQGFLRFEIQDPYSLSNPSDFQ